MKMRNTLILFLSILLLSCARIVLAPAPMEMMGAIRGVLIYDNIWGTIYHAEARQCDATPTITGSGYEIKPSVASDLRIIAISHEMLYDMWRRSLIDTLTDHRFNGKIAYGDTIWVESPRDSIGHYIYPNLNGYWIVEDTKNKRYKNSVDFLQTKNDWGLFNNDSTWNGKFENLKIYKYHERT